MSEKYRKVSRYLEGFNYRYLFEGVTKTSYEDRVKTFHFLNETGVTSFFHPPESFYLIELLFTNFDFFIVYFLD